MTGFEPRTSGIESDRSTNWATTTAQNYCRTFKEWHWIVLFRHVQGRCYSYIYENICSNIGDAIVCAHGTLKGFVIEARHRYDLGKTENKIYDHY